MPSAKEQLRLDSNNNAFGPNSYYRVRPEYYSEFDDIAIDKNALPDYAQHPSRENLIKASEILDKRFNYRDWIERMEGRPISDKEFKALREKYPIDQKIIRDVKWEDSWVPSKAPNEAHVGKAGTQDPEIEGIITAHEKDHTYGIPKISDEEIRKNFGYIWSSYLREKNGAEMLARLGQIANWYGIESIKNQPLTGDMIKYAANQGRYFKDANIDNNMFDFFNILMQNNTWDSAAQMYNKYGKSLIMPLTTGAGSVKLLNKNEND